MKVLIHACCADCLLKMVKSLADKKVEIAVYFYNPNIHPRAEYLSRLKAIKQIAEKNNIKLMITDWSPREWFEGIRGCFSKPKRCERCWNLRLRKTFEYAKNHSFEGVSTTLLTSHYQDEGKIEEIGKKLEKEFEIKFLIPKKVVRNLETGGFYKQNYCGCCYSLVETWGEKFKNKNKGSKLLR